MVGLLQSFWWTYNHTIDLTLNRSWNKNEKNIYLENFVSYFSRHISLPLDVKILQYNFMSSFIFKDLAIADDIILGQLSDLTI